MASVGRGASHWGIRSAWMYSRRQRIKTSFFIKSFASATGSNVGATVLSDFILGSRFVADAKFYSYGDYYYLPDRPDDLRYFVSDSDIANILSTIDSSYVDMSGPQPLRVFMFKFVHTNNTDEITITWTGKSEIDASLSTVILEIYNQYTQSWEVLQDDNTTSAGTDITLTGTTESPFDYYYDANNMVTARVYQ